MLNKNYALDFCLAVDRSHTIGMSQITAVLYEYLLVSGWTPDSIDLLADNLKSSSELERLRGVK